MFILKNVKIIFVLLILSICCKAFADDSVTRFHWALGTAAISYGDSETDTAMEYLSDNDYSRIILSGELGFSFKLDEMLRFVVGGNLVYDSFWKDSQSAFFLDYALFGGMRVYPGLGGLNFGLEYNTGRRSNFYKLDDISVDSSSTKWGNGFRIVTEYDFSVNTTGFAPVVGFSYRRMPRGGFADNIFTFYFRFSY